MSKIKRHRLTQRIVDALKPVTKETWLMDSEVVGLGVRQQVNAKPAYVLRWKDNTTFMSRDRKKTLGPTTVALDTIRLIARQTVGYIASGENPNDQSGKERWKQTVADLVERVVDDMRSKGRAPTYISDFTQQTRDHVLPILGAIAVFEVKADDVDAVLRKLRTHPALHNRVLAGLSRMFKLAIRWGYRSDDPTFGAERTTEVARERHVTDEELAAILGALQKVPVQTADAIRLLTWTGSRQKELFSAKWKDFDLDVGVWTKPAQYVKQRRTHTVQLHPLAVATLKRMKDEAKPNDEDTYVFPSARGAAGGSLTEIKHGFAAVLREAGIVVNTRPHDLRKAFATRLFANGTDLKTVMSLTGHTQVSVLLKHYVQAVPERQNEALGKMFTPK